MLGIYILKIYHTKTSKVQLDSKVYF